MSLLRKIMLLINQNTNKSDLTQIEIWKSDAEKSVEQLRAIGNIDQALETMKDYKVYDKEAAFEKITGEAYHQSNIIKLSWKPLAIAASSILILSILFFNKRDTAFNTKTFSADALKEIELQDQSLVTLESGSKLTTLDLRTVSLSGRGFFKIKTTSDKQKFVVKLNKGFVTVLGTQFSITSNELINEIDVQEGKVKYEYNGQTTILIAGQYCTLVNDKLLVGTTSENTFSWKNQSLDFKDTQLSDAIKDISKYYNIDISIEDNVVIKSTCRLTTQVKNESINQMMEELKTIFNITYHKKGKGYVITAIKC